MDTVRAALHFCLFCQHEHLLFLVEPSHWLPRYLFLPGIPLQLSGLPFLLLFHKTCLDLTMLRLSQWQGPVKLCPYDKEELAIWFRLIEAQFTAAGINPKISGKPMLWPACPNKSFGTF